MANPRIPYRFSTSRPRLPDFRGKRIVAHVVVNVEHWLFDQPMPRTIITPPHGRETVPDVPNFSWVDYGMRCGLPRMLELIQERSLPASTSFNAGVIEAYPEAAEAMRAAGWEFIGHGLHQRAVNHAEGGEESVVSGTLERIAAFTGTRPRGWLSPGLRETLKTPEILVSQGIGYVCDWVIEDRPVWMATEAGPLVAMPYNLEINDSIVYAIEKHATGEMAARLENTLACFGREAQRHGPRILAIGLHPHLIGVPHRIGEFARMLDALAAHPDVAFATGSEICDWYAAAEPKEAVEV